VNQAGDRSTHSIDEQALGQLTTRHSSDGHHTPRFARTGRLSRLLGPGLITGAADDDPSGIATACQSGARFGYAQLWTILFCLPLMTAVQEACARIGVVTGTGLAGNIKRHYNRGLLYPVVALVVVANTINIGADIAAVADAVRLLVDLPTGLLVISFAVVTLTLELFVPYRRYARILKWLTLSVLAYAATALIVAEPWGELVRATFVPHIEFTSAFFYLITGVLGTTISPYMFFWQASEEVEEQRASATSRHSQAAEPPQRSIRDLRVDTAIGMTFSQIGTWFMIVTAATVLHAQGITNIASAADAARALEPLVRTFPHSGEIAKGIFATGIIGLGLLAVPVLAGSASYAASEALGWPEGLDRRLREASGFYAIIAGAVIVGLLLVAIGVDPIKALISAAVFNGVAAVPLVFCIGMVARDQAIMGEQRSRALSQTLLWAAFAAMAASSITLFATLINH